MAVWRWSACDLKTGLMAAELPLKPGGTIATRLSAVGSGGFYMPTTDPACPPDWDLAVIEDRTVIVGEVNDQILWHGMVSQLRITDKPVVDITCNTTESYTERRYVDNPIGPLINTDQHDIVAALIGHANVNGIGIVMDAPASGVRRDRTEYQRYEDQQILAMLENLSEADQGPEWTLHASWLPGAPRRLQFTMVVRTPYIGAAIADPTWRFDLPGNVVSFEQIRGERSNVVVAGGQGDGAERIMSTSGIAHDTAALAAGWPLLEYRHATQLETREAVDAAAKGELETRRRGAQTLKLTIKTENMPDGSMWGLGDTARIAIAPCPQLPRGLNEVWRITGWELDPLKDTVSPTLMQWQG